MGTRETSTCLSDTHHIDGLKTYRVRNPIAEWCSVRGGEGCWEVVGGRLVVDDQDQDQGERGLSTHTISTTTETRSSSTFISSPIPIHSLNNKCRLCHLYTTIMQQEYTITFPHLTIHVKGSGTPQEATTLAAPLPSTIVVREPHAFWRWQLSLMLHFRYINTTEPVMEKASRTSLASRKEG